MRRKLEAEDARRANSPITRMVVRNERGEPLAALGCGMLGALAMFGALYALGANEVKFVCSGFVVLASIAFAGATFFHGRDQKPKLVIGPTGIKNMRSTPPTTYPLTSGT
jgi:hypothetical protein